MNIKLQIKHAWKRLTLPRQSWSAQFMRDLQRSRRQDIIRKNKQMYDQHNWTNP
jgi:hypothetical protein